MENGDSQQITFTNLVIDGAKVKSRLKWNQQMDNLQTPCRGWARQISKLKILYPELGDEDFRYDYGKKEEMMHKLQSKIGVTRPDLNELISGTKFKEKKLHW